MTTESTASLPNNEGTDELEARFLAELDAEDTDTPATGTDSETATDDEADDEDAPAVADDDAPGDTEEPPAPRKWKVKAAGEEHEVEESELVAGYQRQADYTKKAMALAEKERQVVADRAQYVERLNAVESILTAQAHEPDWAALREQLPPEEFAARHADFSIQQANLQKFQAERAREQARYAADQERARAEFVQAQQELLYSKMPMLRDPAKSAAVNDDIVKFATEMGYTPEQLSNVVDHRDILVLHKAAQYDKLVAKAKQAKPTNATPAPAVQPSRPKATANRTEARANTEAQSARKQLRERGTIDAATRAFMSIL